MSTRTRCTDDVTMYLGKQFISKKHGVYTIIAISDMEHPIGNLNRQVEVEFEKSGGRNTGRLRDAIDGLIADPQCGLRYDKIYYSDNNGPYVILDIQRANKKLGRKDSMTQIKFINTGTIRWVKTYSAIIGAVGDPECKTVIHVDTNLLTQEEKESRLWRLGYKMWHSMMRRCDNENYQYYDSYGGAGVYVCDRWKNKELFLEDLPKLFQYDKWARFPTAYSLDKDYLQFYVPKNKRIYSPETCILMRDDDNLNLRNLEGNLLGNTSCIYNGVSEKHDNYYTSSIIIDKHAVKLGTFTNPIAAANQYNRYYDKYADYELISMHNNVPYMSIDEIIKYAINPDKLYAKEYGTDPNLKIMAMKKKVPINELPESLATKVMIPGRPLAIKALPRYDQLPPGSQSINPPYQQPPAQQQYEVMADFVDPNTRRNVPRDPAIQQMLDIMRQYQEAQQNQNIQPPEQENNQG